MGKYYAVARGRKPGIYESWDEAEAQVKGFPKARFKSFKKETEAKKFMDENVLLSDGDKKTAGRKVDDDADAAVSKRRRVLPASDKKLMILVGFDGGSRGNPGVAGAGAEVIIRKMTKNVQKSRKKIHARTFVGYKATNNVAEYNGLVCGLRHAMISIKKIQNEHRSDVFDVDLVVQGDSDLIIQQMNGSYQCRSEDLVPFYKDANKILTEIEKISNNIKTKFEHVYRCDNSVADGLANEAMDAKKTWMTCSEDREDEESEGEDVDA